MALVPERRTDKNGKTSTRWVKPDKAPKTSSRVTPAPKASEAAKEERLALRRANKIKRIAKAIANDIYFSDEEDVQMLMDENLSPLSDRTLDCISATLKEGKDHVNYIDYVVRDYREPRVQEMIWFRSVFHLDTDTAERDSILDQIKRTPRFANIKDLTTLTGEDRQAVEAIIRVSGSVLVSQEIKDIGNDLRELAVVNKDRADEIAAFIEERKTTDTSLINEYLNGIATGLRDGAL